MERGKEIWGGRQKEGLQEGTWGRRWIIPNDSVPSEVVTRSLSLLEPQSEANRTQCKY